MLIKGSSEITHLSLEECLVFLRQQLVELFKFKEYLGKEVIQLSVLEVKELVREVLKELNYKSNELESFDDLMLHNAKLVHKRNIKQI